MSLVRCSALLLCALSLSLSLPSPSAYADPAEPAPPAAEPAPPAAEPAPIDPRIEQRLEELTREVAALRAKPSPAPAPAPAPSPATKALQVYGVLDLSLEASTKGLAGKLSNDGAPPVGNVGWMPAVSTNISYLGVRGQHALGAGLAAVFQLETQLDISATAGTVNTNSNNDAIVKGALTSRTSYVGVTSPYGAIKIGKTDGLMKLATARLNPFVGTVGDYASIIGNTGGDNRVEFGTRLDHAIWYESPTIAGFALAALWAPGQNRATDNSIVPAGEAGCSGGNVPGSGALAYGCNDGAFGAAFGASLTYERGPLYLAAAYELHRAVNRTSDADGTVIMDQGVSYTFDGTVGIGDEWGWRVGARYALPSKTVIAGVYEDLRRDMPYHYFDERSRSATWATATQEITPKDSVAIGWAHAFSSPGSLGEHNIETTVGADNSANLITGMYRRSFDDKISWYVVYAMQANHAAAHYDLGAGGRGVTTDCHDGSQIAAVNADGSLTDGGPFCFTGGRLQAVSVGMSYRF